jgi:hypothetical protein
MTCFVSRLAPRFLAAARTVAVALAVGMAAPALAVAQSPTSDAAPMPDQVTLTPDMVQRFIDSWPDFKALGDKLATDRGVDPSAGTPTAAFSSWAKEADAKAEIDAVVTKHGFASLQDWIGAADSVMIAFSYDEQELSEERLAEILAEVEASPQVPPDQKAAAAAQVREYFAAARMLKPLPGNVETIEPFLDELALVAGGAPDDAGPAGGGEPGGEGEPMQE